LRLDKALVFDDYIANRTLGGFILIDRFSNETAAIGLVASDVFMRDVDKVSAWTRFILDHAGEPSSQKRLDVTRNLFANLGTAAIIGGAVGLWSHDTAFGLGVFGLTSLTRAAAEWASGRLFKNQDGFADGDGI